MDYAEQDRTFFGQADPAGRLGERNGLRAFSLVATPLAPILPFVVKKENPVSNHDARRTATAPPC